MSIYDQAISIGLLPNLTIFMAKSVSELLKFRQLQEARPRPPTRDYAPVPHLGQSPKTPNIGSRSARAMNVVLHFLNRVDTPLVLDEAT
jgi:hypothetical protein